jgi:hypothetical protein
MQLYTSDMDVGTLGPSLEKAKVDPKELSRRRKIVRRKVLDTEFDTASLFDSSTQLQQLRFSFDSRFNFAFDHAVTSYINGNWPLAKD